VVLKNERPMPARLPAYLNFHFPVAFPSFAGVLIPQLENRMKIKDLSALEEREVFPGYTGKFIHSNQLTIAHWRIKANHPLPEHSHPHEQIVHVVEGEFELTVQGVPHRLGAGMVFVIPSNVPHSGIGISDCKIIDTFCPVREDYKF
jgi:quercetin dioxygenase-like cupin family protein